MIARDIIVSFYILSLLKYDRIFGKNWPSTLRESLPGLAPEVYVIFLFYYTFKYQWKHIKNWNMFFLG